MGWVSALLLTSSALSSLAFMGQGGTRATLERKFLNTSFCKTYRCVLKSQRQGDSVFRLNNALEVGMDPCCAVSFRYDLGKPHRLRAVEKTMLKALMLTAVGQALPFDLEHNCSSVAAIRRSKPTAFTLPGPFRLYGVASCVEDTTGIPAGQMNTAPEFVPFYYFTVYLPV